MALLRKRKSSPHARGILKRRRMLDAACALLAHHDPHEITLGDVARAAGVATSSADHFYVDVEELFLSLQAELQRNLVGALQRPPRASCRSDRARRRS